jgi:uncharacterized protein YjiS (DUF1127 family)
MMETTMAVFETRASFSGLTDGQAHGRFGHGLARLAETFDATLDLGVTALFTWQRRISDRMALQSLDDHMLRDIGLSRADVEHEASKPFWKA